MNELTVFKNEQFGQVRTINRDGEPWFVAADVCRALDLDKTWNALQRIDEDEKGTTSISTPGGEQKMTIVNEPGLYSLVLGSRKPEARAFKRWITHEVIPAIRKTGSYGVKSNAITIEPETLKLIVSTTISECMKQMIPYVQKTEVKELKKGQDNDAKHPATSARVKGIGARVPDYGARLTKQMMKRHVTSAELAEEIGVSRLSVRNWMAARSFPCFSNHNKICVALLWRFEV